MFNKKLFIPAFVLSMIGVIVLLFALPFFKNREGLKAEDPGCYLIIDSESSTKISLKIASGSRSFTTDTSQFPEAEEEIRLKSLNTYSCEDPNEKQAKKDVEAQCTSVAPSQENFGGFTETLRSLSDSASVSLYSDAPAAGSITLVCNPGLRKTSQRFTLQPRIPQEFSLQTQP